MNNAEQWFDPPLSGAVYSATPSDLSPALKESPGAIVWLEDATAYLRAYPTSGNGAILYQGTRHALNISGLSPPDSSATRIFATGIAKRLRTLLDFAGNYAAITVERRFNAGNPFSYLRNERGVLIQLVAKQAGLRFEISPNGVQIDFQHRL